MRAPFASLLAAAAILATPALASDAASPSRHSNPAMTSALNASQASRRAASLANAAALRRFGAAPFSATDAMAQRGRGQWHWQATAGCGKTDLLASVSFSRNGDAPMVSVSQLVLPQW